MCELCRGGTRYSNSHIAVRCFTPSFVWFLDWLFDFQLESCRIAAPIPMDRTNNGATGLSLNSWHDTVPIFMRFINLHDRKCNNSLTASRFTRMLLSYGGDTRLMHCATRRKVAGSIPDGVIGMAMALGSTQPLTEMNTRSTGLFISPSGTSELDCATTKTDTAERSISIGRESLKVFFVLGPWRTCRFHR